MSSIRFENISKNFSKAAVIKDLDLTVREGEFFTFVGPSGCGKSTILHLIAGLESATSGRILFGDREVTDLDPRERDVALVFQSYALYPHLTVFENIAFPLRMHGQAAGAISSEVGRVAGLLGIGDLLQKKPRQLSGGQRQRVALGRAIVRRPKVFLMDEPLSNLDARLRAEMRVELKRLHRELGITTVYVTHDQAEAMGLSDRVAVLRAGIVQQCDSPERVYRYPANTFVAGFIGVPGMNLIPATVVREQPLTVDCSGVLLAADGDAPPVKEVIVGIRPEDLHASRELGAGGIEMTVAMTEPSGPVTWVELERGGLKLKAASRPEDGLRAGDRCTLFVPPGRMVLFHPATGELLGPQASDQKRQPANSKW